MKITFYTTDINLVAESTVQHWRFYLNLEVTGTTIDNNLGWSNHFNKIIKECLVLIATLKKLKRFSKSHVRKQLVRSFVLTNLDYCNALLINTFCNARKNYCKKCNKKIAAPGLVCNKHGKIDEVLKPSWLPVDDRLYMNTTKPAYKGLHDQNFPYQLKLWCETITRNSSS